MQPLQTNKKVLMWLRLCPLDDSIDESQKPAINIFALFIFLGNVSAFSADFAFFLVSMNTNLEDCLFALFQVAASASSTYAEIVAFFVKDQLNDIFEKLSDIQDAVDDEDSIEILAEVNNHSEWMWQKFYTIMVKGISIYIVVASLISVLLCFVMFGHFDAAYVRYPYKFVLPWDQETLPGYIAVIFFSIVSVDTYFIANAAFLLLFISMCLYHEVFNRIIREWGMKIGQHENERAGKQRLCKLVHFNVMVKDWFLESSDVYSPLILIQLICSMIFLASTIFQIDLHLVPFDFNSICLSLLGASISLSNLYLYCYFGKLATDSYAETPSYLYESNWQNLPVELQKYLTLIIANMQRPLEYHGFGIAVLNLETFSAQLKTVLSYYMMFKAVIE